MHFIYEIFYSLQISLSYLPVLALINSIKTYEIIFVPLWYYQVIHFISLSGKKNLQSLCNFYFTKYYFLCFTFNSPLYFITSELSTGWPIILGNSSLGCIKFQSVAMGAEGWGESINSYNSSKNRANVHISIFLKLMYI